MNLAQHLGELRLQLANEMATHLPGYKPRKDALPKRIYDALAAADQKLSWAEIVKLVNITAEQKNRGAHALMDLIESGHINREGKRRLYKYWVVRRAN